MICAVLLLAASTAGCQRSPKSAPARPATRAEVSRPIPRIQRPPRPAPPTLSVHKCVSPDGSLAYQDTPCEDGSRQVSRHDEPIAPKASRATIVARAEREAAEIAAIAHGSARRNSGGWNAANERVAAQRRYCEATRADVQRERDQLWNRATMGMLRAWDERVRRACGP